jgi:hypothetical protein
LEEAAFFDYFLCSSKESDPPAGEAVTAIKARQKKQQESSSRQKQKTQNPTADTRR